MTLCFRLIGVALFLLPTVSYPQAQPQNQTPKPSPAADDVVRISTQLVQIDAVVTDRKGEHIDDLTEDDFDLTVDGKRQKLNHFRLVRLPDLPPPPANNRNALLAPPTSGSIRPDQIRRTIAFVVDDLGLSFESTYYAKEAIRKFLREQLQEGDLVAIIRTGRGMGVFQQFTTDKRILLAAVDKLSWNPFSREMIPRFDSTDQQIARRDNNMARDSLPRDSLDDFRETIFAVGTLGALNFVVRGLLELPGRKTAILISDGFSLFGRNRDNTQVLDQVRRLVDLANRSSVVIYSIDAKGLLTLSPTAADAGGGNGPQMAERMAAMSRQNFDSQQGLTYLARETGGFAVLNNNDLNLGIQKTLKDQQSYYLLGFDPEDEKFDRKYHSIKVRVSKPGMSVRTRAGFLGFPDKEKSLEASGTRNAQILSALFSPFGARDLTMQMTSFFFNTANRNRKLKSEPESISFVRSLLHIDAGNLTFKDGEGEYANKKVSNLEIASFTFNESGQIVEQQARAFTIALTAVEYALALKRGLGYTNDAVIKKPGAYQFRSVIRDAETGALGSAGQFIQVPDLDKKRLALSGLVVGTAAKGNDPPQDDSQPSPEVRRFARTGVVDYALVIFNPTPDRKSGKPQLIARAELYREGKRVVQLPSNAVPPGDESTPKRLQIAGRLQLNGLQPGVYQLHLIIEDSLAEKKYSIADQWMDFSVQ